MERPSPPTAAHVAPLAGLALPELFERLQANAQGLSSAEAERRLARSGANETRASAQGSRLIDALRPLANPLVAILLLAGVAAAVLGQRTDASIIFAIVASSALLDSLQTFRSRAAVSRLQAQVAPTATALRDGSFQELPRAALVPGDVVRLCAGDLVPADVRLLEAVDLHVQQAALTGEALPAEKVPRHEPLTNTGADSAALLFLGTSVVSGTGTALVVVTGHGTAFGDVVARLAARPDETEFERGMRQFGLLILRTVFFLVLFILVVNIAFGRNAMESLLFSVALAVGLTPEFLPLITTVTLAEGALRMAEGKVIVKHLSSIQNLGSVDILCSDKTGTLTSGTMSLDGSVDPFGSPSQRPLRLGRLNSRFETGIKSPLDAAILAGAPLAEDGYEKTDEIPFDFERRRLSVVLRRGDEILMVTKGAPEGLLSACTNFEIDGAVRPLESGDRARAEATFRELSRSGLRLLAVAHRTLDRPSGHAIADERGMTLVGYLTFADHLLDGTADAIARLRRDGVAVKILTGDNELVTAYACKQAGIPADEIVLGSDVEELEPLALGRVAERATVFARMSPAGKHRVIRALKARGHTVGFLGDGINDAPSLHGADVGISVAGAVDIAREAADIVLLEKSLDVLHAGILAGRRSFGNVLKYVLMGTSSNFGNMFSMAGATLFLPFLPMLPTQLLLNNFLYDLAQVTIPSDNVDAEYIERPRHWDVNLIRRFMLVIGPVSSLYDFLTFFLLLKLFHFREAAFRTGWFMESLATQTLVLFVIRTFQRPWQSRPSRPLVATTLLVASFGVLLPYLPFARRFGFEPLPLVYLPTLAALVLTYLVIVELVKARVLKATPPLQSPSR